jgi:hypothetical protein
MSSWHFEKGLKEVEKYFKRVEFTELNAFVACGVFVFSRNGREKGCNSIFLLRSQQSHLGKQFFYASFKNNCYWRGCCRSNKVWLPLVGDLLYPLINSNAVPSLQPNMVPRYWL